MDSDRVSASFRDPSGFLFVRNTVLYRQINQCYKQDYDLLMNSGLYRALIDAGLLVKHEEVGIEPQEKDRAYKVIKPDAVSFVSYPFEWCFSQLKDAALATLKIQKTALQFGMSLKDASAYNIQFENGRPVLIDTLSFEKYKEGQPWIAYRQFCQHFLNPLLLISYKDFRLNHLSKIFIDGIPVDLASRLLPWKTRFSPKILIHVHVHAASQRHYASKPIQVKKISFSRHSFQAMIENLESLVKKIHWGLKKSEWGAYYQDTNYSTEAFNHKKQVVAGFIHKIKPASVWDLGSNDGTFSRIASGLGIHAVSFDIDPLAVEKNYRQQKSQGESNLLPLILDLTNPSPAIGWENRERMSLLNRGPVDMVFALALIHHLAIANNLPLAKIADFFSKICQSLIIEFVPKNDSQVQRLLATREDIFPDYTQAAFEREMSRYFKIVDTVCLNDSSRILYLMQNKNETRKT